MCGGPNEGGAPRALALHEAAATAALEGPSSSQDKAEAPGASSRDAADSARDETGEDDGALPPKPSGFFDASSAGECSAAVPCDSDEDGSLESDEDEDEDEAEDDSVGGCSADGAEEVAVMGCLRAAARHYPMLASLAGLAAEPSSAAPSKPDEDEGAPTRVVLLSKASPPSSPTRNCSSKTNRRRIHPLKPPHLRPSGVTFSELVSVKEIMPYEPATVHLCFYSAEELRCFRREYLLGMPTKDDEEDVFEMMQDAADAVCGCVRGMVSGVGPMSLWQLMGAVS